LVATDRSSGRRSPTKAGGDPVQVETYTVRCGPTPLSRRGWTGHRGKGSGGGGAVHRCLQEENGRTRDGVGRHHFMAARRRGGEEQGRGSVLARDQLKGEEGVRLAWRAHERGSRLAAARTRWRRAIVGRCARAGARDGAAPTSGPVQRVGLSGIGREEREGG
jgi:hypothetical protein